MILVYFVLNWLLTVSSTSGIYISEQGFRNGWKFCSLFFLLFLIKEQNQDVLAGGKFQLESSLLSWEVIVCQNRQFFYSLLPFNIKADSAGRRKAKGQLFHLLLLASLFTSNIPPTVLQYSFSFESEKHKEAENLGCFLRDCLFEMRSSFTIDSVASWFSVSAQWKLCGGGFSFA